MDCELVKEPFRPFSIKINFETLEEAQGFYNIMSYTCITKAAGIEEGAADVREILKEACEDVYSDDSFSAFRNKM